MGCNREKPRILIAGLGNILLKDDGVGVHTVRELQRGSPPGVLIVEIGTAVLDALHLFERAERILAVDAMRVGGSPGTIYSFSVNDVAEPGQKASLHELSLLGALRLLPNHQAPQITILGVEPESIDYGTDLSPTLQAMMPKLTQIMKEIISQWGAPPGPKSCRECPDSLQLSSKTLFWQL